jgi:hypothetical protein
MLPVSVGDDATLEVRTYPTFTSSLEALADWLQAEGITQVVMEATGQQLEALLVCAGGARVGAAVGQRPPRQDPAWPQDTLYVKLRRHRLPPRRAVGRLHA